MKKLSDFDYNERFEMARHVKDTFDQYQEDLQHYHAVLLNIYKEVNKTEEEWLNEWDTKFHVSKMRQTENKTTPKIMAKNPRFIVSWRTDVWDYGDKELPEEEKAKKIANKKDLPEAIQDYLNKFYEKQEIRKKMKLLAKSGVRYGIGWGKVGYRAKQVKKGKRNKVIEGTPYIDIKSFLDIYFDPRYTTLDEMPAIVEIARNVRISELEASDKYDDEILEELKTIQQERDEGIRREIIERIAGIQSAQDRPEPDFNNLELKIYEGYYGDDDDFVRITTVSDLFVIGYEEIEEFSYEEFRVFEDTETFLANGFLADIMGLEKELNWKKNAASEYINMALHRTMVLSANSGIDPADLYSWPWHVIIPDSMTAREVIDNHLLELPHRDLSVQYFNEQNDFERQIQAASYTIDIANRSPWVGQTNTATGEKIQYAEMNDVVNDVRQSFEDSLARLAYKILEVTYQNMDTNIYFKGEKKFWTLHKEAFADCLRRFDIRVEANSSSSMDVEARRADAIAKKNIAMEAMQAGAMPPEGAKELFKEIFGTFEGTNVAKLFPESLPMPAMPWMGQPQGQPPAQPQPTNPLAVWLPQ